MISQGDIRYRAHMRAMVLNTAGQPLELVELPVPQPKAKEVLVKVLACGVCRTDLHLVEGELPDVRMRPSFLGTKSSEKLSAPGRMRRRNWSVVWSASRGLDGHAGIAAFVRLTGKICVTGHGLPGTSWTAGIVTTRLQIIATAFPSRVKAAQLRPRRYCVPD